jgi:hypothetical protein
MTIDDAIKFKETYLRSPMCNLSEYEREADQLSIEALKAVKAHRPAKHGIIYTRLPGEDPQ